MGCGASAQKPVVTAAMHEAMCQDGCRRIQVICIKAALDKDAKDVKITPPAQVEKLKGCVKALNDYASKLKEDKPEKEEEDKPAEKKGGLMGLAAGAMDLGAKAAEGAADLAKKGASMGLGSAAKALDALTAKLDEPFQTVANDVLDKKRTQLYNICVTYINGYVFKEPSKLVRGGTNLNSDGSWDAEGAKNQWAQVKDSDTISRTLAQLAGADLCDKLLPEVQSAIEDHAVTQNWDSAQKAYNDAYDLANKAISTEDLTKLGVERIKCDLNVYITKEIFKVLVEIMSATEKDTRKSPEGKDITAPKKPESFAKIFSDCILYESDFKYWEKEQVP